MAGIVFNAVAVANLLQHLEVVDGALLKPLGFEQLAVAIEPIESITQLLTNCTNG